LLKTDKGLLFESFDYENSLAFDHQESDGIDPTDYMISFQIFVANHGYIFHRKYMKVQTLIAKKKALYP
jgi:hypothetical protein